MSIGAPELPVSRSRTPILFTVLVLLVIGVPMAAAQLHSGGFLPHSFCYLGNVPLTVAHVTSDLLIGLSYVAISCTLLYLVRRSQGAVPFHWMFLAFGLFIVACGGTHFMEVLTIWKPYYWVSAAVKVVTAAASVSTAIALPLLSPVILHRLQEAKTAAARSAEIESANNELQRLYRELQEAERLKDALVAQNAARIGDWSWDVRTGKNTWSEAVEVMHGLEPRSYDGRYESWWATVHPDDQILVKDAIGRAIQTGDYDVEYRTIRSDQSIYWTAARGKMLFDSEGKPQRMIGICLDVTGRKANEEALLRAEKLAAAGRLAATVAHEINNPLEAVMNLVFLARTNGPDNTALLEMAERQLARVSAIAKQTLGFYRDTSSPADTSVSELIDSVLETYAAKVQTKQLQVTKRVDTDAVLRVRRGELHQVIANLVSNAIDASTAGGSIGVYAEVSETGTISISVEDEGAGIPVPVAQRLFEPFFTTKRDVGTGLGLWVSKRLVEQMGGTLTFQTRSAPETHGTRFEVRLRLGATEAAAAAQTQN